MLKRYLVGAVATLAVAGTSWLSGGVSVQAGNEYSPGSSVSATVNYVAPESDSQDTVNYVSDGQPDPGNEWHSPGTDYQDTVNYASDGRPSGAPCKGNLTDPCDSGVEW